MGNWICGLEPRSGIGAPTDRWSLEPERGWGIQEVCGKAPGNLAFKAVAVTCKCVVKSV